MTALAPTLARLGLSQYLDSFITEGFDTWETLQDITESDLRELGVKLGHRRKLQREIAIARGIGAEETLDTQSIQSPHDDVSQVGCERVDESKAGKPTGPGGKRKYRRHPKPDEFAPERAPSAYVIFSNKMREDLKPQNLSFTEIAKRVGEQWQLLSPDHKGQFETQAATAKERYRIELEKYKKTDNYREYSEYLLEFKHKNATLDDKRPRLEKESSVGSSQSGPEQGDHVESKQVPTRHRRTDSFGSMNNYSTASDQPSPTSTNVSRPLPSFYAGPSHFRPPSPISASMTGSWASRTSGSLNSVFAAVDRPPPLLSDVHQRMASSEPMDHRPSNHIAGLMQDSSLLRSRSSPATKSQRDPSQSSVSSPRSSIFSNNTTSLTAHSSTFTTASSVDNRRLPPLSTVVGSPDLGHPATPHSATYPFRPDFAKLPTPIAVVAAPSGHRRISTDSGKPRPSFKGEYEPRLKGGSEPSSWLAQDTQSRSDTDMESPPETLPDSDADPLSVLACAGRMVDQEERRVRMKKGGKGGGKPG